MKKKNKKKQPDKSGVPSKSQYKNALENVVGKNVIDETELEELTSGLDDVQSDSIKSETQPTKQPDTMTFDEDDVGDDLDELLDLDESDDDLEDISDETIDDQDETQEVDPLKQKPIKVVDEASKRKRELQSKTIDNVDSGDFDGFTTDDALALVSDIEDDVEDDLPIEDADNNDLDLDNNLSDDNDDDDNDDDDDLLDDDDDDDDFDFESENDDLEVFDDDNDDDLLDEEDEVIGNNVPETVPEAPHKITAEEAFNALDPVQQTILRQLSKMDTDSLKTQAQMVEENLYMQGQIREWSNTYALQMRHLNAWQDYSAKLKDLLIAQNDQFEDEKDHLIKRHQIQMRNLRASLEEDYAEREDKIRNDQRIAREMVEEASRLIEQARQHDAASKLTIEGLRDQIKVLTTRPSLPTDNAVPVAPSDSLRDIVNNLGLKTKSKKTNDTDDEVGDLFADENW